MTANGLGRAIDVEVSQTHVCAVLASGRVACWGDLHGPLQPIVTTPVLLEGIDDAVSVAENCALRKQGPARCWRPAEWIAREVPGSEGAIDIASGPCFLLADGSVRCLDAGNVLAPATHLTGLRAIDRDVYNARCIVRTTGKTECPGGRGGPRGGPDVCRRTRYLACRSEPGVRIQEGRRIVVLWREVRRAREHAATRRPALCRRPARMPSLRWRRQVSAVGRNNVEHI